MKTTMEEQKRVMLERMSYESSVTKSREVRVYELAGLLLDIVNRLEKLEDATN